ncbi:MAG: hypothetical protein HZB55_23225 [Deltaproteobacteria bacterium]|nr:hypothetical protein [Deltaproteobacteria bacterium]
MRIRVECLAGFRGEEAPRRIFFGGRAVDVSEVRDRWLSPDHRYFKVLGADGGEYILRHDTESGGWELTSFRRAGS